MGWLALNRKVTPAIYLLCSQALHYFHVYRCTAMYMASIPSAKPKHSKANVWKLAVWPKDHMVPRITAHTTVTPITYR